MRRKLAWMVLFSAVILFTALYHAEVALATPPSGFTGATIALGRLSPFKVFNRSLVPNPDHVWVSRQHVKGSSDLYVQSNVWDPGGTTGWHTHPGHSLITVTSGTLTAYEGDDPDCQPTVYTTGMSFVDPGHGHIHIIRNEGTVPATAIAVQLIAAGATRRIDVPDPGNCHF